MPAFPRVIPGSAAMLCAGHSHEPLCPCGWGTNSSPIHPWSLSSLPFLIGNLHNHPLISAQVSPKLNKPHHGALQAPPGPSSPPALLSYHPPGITFSSLTISLLFQALPDPMPSSQAGFCTDTPRDWSGEGNATLPCVLHTSPSQHLPLFWQQQSHWGFIDSWGWLFKFMPFDFFLGGGDLPPP